MKNTSAYKKITFTIVMVALLLPLFQTATGLFRVRMLYGDYVVPSCPAFTFNGWLDGNFTQVFDEYVETHVGFRRFFIRLRNSVRYSFLHQSNEQVVLGKNDVLYEKNYIKALYGEDSVTYEQIRMQTEKLKVVHDSLQRKGIQLLVMLAPGKASMYPAEIPFEYRRGKLPRPVSYLAWKNELKKNQLPYMDMRAWFLHLHDTSSLPVFNKLGVHWTVYGSYLAADSMLNYMEQLGHWQLGHAVWDEVEHTTKYRETDADLMEIMNLLTDIPSEELAYPKVKYTRGKDKPNVLAVGDSYYWSFLCDSIHEKLFADSSHFWFYNEKVYTNNQKFQRMVDKTRLREEIEKRNIIILLSTEANLHKFPYGFADELYQLYTGKN